MSLFGSLQTASNTLQAMQIGLQVVSNNIANANTEGFIREKVNYTPAPVLEKGNLTIGLGVLVDSITQVVDDFLGEQLRNATGERASAQIQNGAYKDLERLLGELGDRDLSSALTSFFGSIEDTLNPISGDRLSSRNLAILDGGQTLAAEVRRIDSAAKEIRDNLDTQVTLAVGQVNQLAEQITRLNVQITQVEGGGSGNSDAGALRAARNQAVGELAELVSITVSEQESGGLAISVGGELLVFEGIRRDVALESGDGSDEAASTIVFADTGKDLDLSSGRVHGLTVARDEVVDGFRDDLAEFTGALIFEFNRVHSQGQGLSGFRTLTGADRVLDASAPLDEAGLAFTPEHGSFQITVLTEGGLPKTTTIDVELLGDGANSKATLASVAEQLDAVAGLDASIDATGRLTISAIGENATFAFSNDTSGFLAAVGLNTFFTGSGPSDIAVNDELDGIQNAGKLALSNQGVGGTTGNAIALAALVDEPLDSLGGASILERYDQVVNELSQRSTVAGSVADGLEVFEGTLAAEFQAISGVNIDEEAIELITLQRIYQATARVIATIQEMLETLVRL